MSHCKNTVYRITTQEQMFMAALEIKPGGAIVMIDPVRLDPVPGEPMTSLQRRLVPLLDKRITVCGTYFYAKLREDDPHYDAYMQEITGIIRPNVKTNLTRKDS